jgi:uncharacterized protein YdaU (DUF1376 family)
MEFDPVVFEGATGMFNDDEKWKYLRCLIHYWYHSHVEGLPNDDEGLFQLCECKPERWMRLKGMIFDNDKFFHLENGKWHQKRARLNYLKKQADLIKKQDQTEPAREAHLTKAATDFEGWLKELESSPAYTGINVRSEFEKARLWIGLPQNKGRILSHRFFLNWLNKIDTPIGQAIARVKAAGVPSLAEVQAYARDKWGEHEKCGVWAISFHSYWNDPARNWKRKNGNQIDWKVDLTAQVAKWRT